MNSTTDRVTTYCCTVVVPVYNGAASIVDCLDALGSQTLPPDQYEVIVVDDGSMDATNEVVSKWLAGRALPHWRLLQQENQGPAAARNRGAAAARSSLILFTDADCAPEPAWVAVLLDMFQDPEVVGAKGTYTSDQAGLVPQFVQAEYEDRYDRMRGSTTIDFIDTYSAAYRRHIFQENGGFDPIFSTASVEDQELSFRLAAKGYRLVFVPLARVRHLHDETIGAYCRRKYVIGYWKALLVQWHPERVVQDSHTPQVLKLQMLLWALIMAAVPIAVAAGIWPVLGWVWWIIGLFLSAFLLTTLPFLRKLGRCSGRLVAIGGFLLAARALSLGIGYVVGTVHFAGTPPGARRPVIPGWKRLVKRSIDVVGALVGLALSMPMIAVAAVAIKLDSPGPVFYLQTRIGEHGRPFHIVKLRSMEVGAEEKLADLVNVETLSEPAYKIRNDPRVTRVGRLLRRSSLDETPQFWNVLCGQMSLVGPRPEEARIVALYDDDQRKRLMVRPGLTGPMQISGRGELPLSERLRLELDYIENYSLWRDVKILVRTLPAVLQGRGAL